MEYTLESMFGIENKTVIVTGGTKGIGKEIAKALACLGANVIPLGSTEKSIAAAKSDFEKEGITADFMQADVADEAAIEKIAAAVYKKYGHIDGLVNCAGIQRLEDCLDTDIENFETVMRVNVTGSMICAKHFGRYMAMQGKGRIVNCSSVRGYQGKARYASYAASKGAINNLTHCLACDLADKGITVNAFAPCFVGTELSLKALQNEETKNWVLSRIPLGRLGEPADMVGAVVFFLSDASSFITGAVLMVDGGWLSA
ncbi:MAG: glucose 1-dehydrogenase [Christensenellaceae bacterium]|nr:glucose 1-dehydrogenase [Christensenellaceae bacterium]